MVDDARTPDRAPSWLERRPVAGGALLLGAHTLLALILTGALVSGAANFGGVGLHDLARVGNGPAYGVAGIWLPVLLNPLAALLSLAVSRRLGWLGPVLCALASVLLALYFSTTFETPVLGG
jgi:hypothetical protein